MTTPTDLARELRDKEHRWQPLEDNEKVCLKCGLLWPEHMPLNADCPRRITCDRAADKIEEMAESLDLAEAFIENYAKRRDEHASRASTLELANATLRARVRELEEIADHWIPEHDAACLSVKEQADCDCGAAQIAKALRLDIDDHTEQTGGADGTE